MDYKNIYIKGRRTPICDVPKMAWGVKPTDGGNLILSPEEKDELLIKEPSAEKWIRPLISAREYLNGEKRYCLWLKEITPTELSNLPEVYERVQKVREFRLNSVAESTRKRAEYPTLFVQNNNPKIDYILIPITTSENREYIPISLIDKEFIPNNSTSFILSDDKYIMGVVMSKMHMTWMKYVCGRLENRYRYSSVLVYNNFPFPKDIEDNNKEKIRNHVQNILDIRNEFPNESLANLYNPLLMPPILKKAHKKLDNQVDKAYRINKFKDDDDRMKLLFELYEELRYSPAYFI